MGQELVKKIVDIEWSMFDAVNRGTGLRASCQEDPETFYIMRASQAEAWTEALRESYYADLLAAEAEGRNLLTEKYARMMESTDPAAFARLRQALPPVDEDTLRLIEEIVRVQLAWKEDMSRRYPRLTALGRTLYTRDDTPFDTSFETYLRGELRTYSPRTIRLYRDMVRQLEAEGENLEERCLLETVKKYGYDSLEQAENRN